MENIKIFNWTLINLAVSLSTQNIIKHRFQPSRPHDNSSEKFLKIHIENQIKAGATLIQIFDSWAGLLEENILKFIYEPTLNLVNHVKKLNVPVICFPRGIKDYKSYCDLVKPNMVNIDYNIDPKKIISEIQIPIQGGLDPKVLLTDKEN